MGYTELLRSDARKLDFDCGNAREAAREISGEITSEIAAKTVSPSLLDPLRRAAFRVFLAAGWLITVCIAAMASLFTPQAWWIAIASALVNGAAARIGHDARSIKRLRTATVLLVALQPLFLLIVMRLSTFEPLTPLTVFVALMALTALCDRIVIYLAAGLIFAALFAFAVAAPNWLFVGEAIWRNALYSFELAIVTTVSATIAGCLQKLVARLEEAQRDSAARADQLHEQADALEMALQRIETEREERNRFEVEQEQARKRQLQRIAQDFEASISVVTQSIGQTASLLERITKTLSAIAHDTGHGAAQVSESAATASHAARMVAQGVAELSASIAEIAADVSQQNELASKATRRSVSGGEAVGDLTRRSETIGEATRAIVRIAERTNLLSLNAAIEAASAGPAGRGFTIVAQEVKALAMQASEAATQIDTFLKGVRSDTHEAERSFEAIDSVIASLAKTATAITWEVESQRKSADAIEDYARSAAEDVSAMAARSETLAETASVAEKLSNQLDNAAATMLRNVRDLEQSTAQFVSNLKAG